MRSLTTAQTAMIDKASKTVIWVVYLYDKDGVGYAYSTASLGAISWGGVSGPIPAWDASSKWNLAAQIKTIVITEFDGVELRADSSGIITPSEVTFTVTNKNNVLSFSDFTGGEVLIQCFVTDIVTEVFAMSWMFKVKVCQPGYQNLKFTCEDFLQEYLRGDYPNTRYPAEIFPSNRTYSNEGVCVPVPFGTVYIPLRDVFITSAGYIMLGPTAAPLIPDWDGAYPVAGYYVSKVRSPRSWGLKSEYSIGSYAFPQSDKLDIATTTSWTVFQAIIADSDNDKIADAHGFWGTPGGPVLDPLVEFYANSTLLITNPADVIRWVLLDMGVPAGKIDETSFLAAAAVYDGWELEFNGAFWYKKPRQEVLSTLLTMCHSCLQVGDKIELHVIVKASQKTITAAEVLRTSEIGEGSFSYNEIVDGDHADAGYVAYPPFGEAQDELQKILVGTDASVSVISDTIVECPFVQDTIMVQKIGTLEFERLLMREAEISFTAKGSCLPLQPYDVITINNANYGGTFLIMIDSVKISKDLSIQISGSKYSIALSDWDDIDPGELSIPFDSVLSASAWKPVMSGPDSTSSVSGISSNRLSGRIRVGDTDNYILIDPSDPLRISLFDNAIEKMRFGNLDGFLGYVANLYGIGVGDSTQYLKYDSIGGLQIAGAISASTIDIGGLDATSFHVDANGNIWSGAASFNILTNPFAVSSSGNIHATSGTIGGFTLSANSLLAGSGTTRIQLDTTTGIHLGSTVFASAPFSVSLAGALTSTSGHVGGWNIGATTISAPDTGPTVIIDSANKRISLLNTTFGQAGVQMDVSGSVGRLYAGDGANKYVEFDGTNLLWKGAFSELTATGHLVASSATISGAITADSGYIGGTSGWVISAGKITSSGIGLATSMGDATYAIWAGDDAPAIAEFSVTHAGVIKATSGTIGGWMLSPQMLQSAPTGSARIELDQDLMRVSIKTATDISVVVMGYLNALLKNDGTGYWGAGDYGFWAKPGDSLRIDGDVLYRAGDWIVENDGSYLVQDGSSNTIIRLGTDAAEKGLFLYNTSGTRLAKFVTDEVNVGSASQYLKYTVAGGLEINGPVRFTGGIVSAASIDGGDITGALITGSVIRTATSGARVELSDEGVAIVSAGTSGKWGAFKYGTGVKYGSGVRAWVGGTGKNVPFYCQAANNYGDFHYVDRVADPTGAAESGDTCVVAGDLKICIVTGTPGTWEKAGDQSVGYTRWN